MELFNEVNTVAPWFFPTMVFVLGACVGSFLNVCIYRIPAEKSVVFPGSTCACGKPIAWFDNIPILSWLILRGRARCCGRPFSIRYPAIELLTALLFLASWMHHPPAKAVVGMVFISIMVCATFIDFDHMIIPDRFAIGGAVVGVLLSGLVPALHDQAVTPYWAINATRAVLEAVIGMFIGSALVLWIAEIAEVVLRKEAMGFGDVKFLGAIGAFCGWQGGVFAVFGGAVLGTIAFAGILIFEKATGRAASPAAEPEQDTSPAPEAGGDSKDESEPESAIGFGRETPFGPMLAAGALLYFLWLHPIVDGYFAEVYKLLTDFS
ncbi:MAG: prepilin peptidase [Opitutaceae bacterium]|nr:prepilin peptidase [Opitutaceae bacterium]